MAVFGNKIAAVVVTYNRCELLQTCIARLRAQVDLGVNELDILVVDNASTDGTQETLAPLVAQDAISYHNTGENLGGAGGFNRGMRLAVERGYDYVWVMDDDCFVHADSLIELLAVDEVLQGEYGFLSSVVRWTDGDICAMNVQRHPLTRNIEDFTLDLQSCTLASFVSLFVPARVIAEVGLPIKDFFIWTDDWEFTRRISRDYPCYVVGRSVVTHASATNGAGTIVDDVPERLDRYKLVYRNDVVLYRGEGARGYAFLVTRGLYHAAKVMATSPDTARGKLKKLGIIARSNLDGLSFHPDIEYATAKEANDQAKTATCDASTTRGA